MIIEKNGTYENPKSGAYIGVVADVAELLNVPGRFGPKNKIRIIWVLDTKDSQGKPYRVMEQINASINEKSRLYEIAKGILGAPPNAKSFDTESLMGKANQLFIVVERGEDGRDYAHVKGILPLPAGAVIPAIPADFVRSKDKKPFIPGSAAPAAVPAPAPVAAQTTAAAVSGLAASPVASNVQF
jgi:hypothetical protein